MLFAQYFQKKLKCRILKNSVAMGRGKHCTPEQREIIKNMICNGNTYAEIRRIFGCSNKLIRNAIIFEEKTEKRGRPTVLSDRAVKRLVRRSKAQPFMSAVELKTDLNIESSVETVRRRLRDNELNACSPRKVPLLSKKNVAKRIQFAKSHLNWPIEKWRNILWTDESKIVYRSTLMDRSNLHIL